MNGTVSRRVFVASVAAGLPLVVSASSGALSDVPAGQSHVHAAGDEAPEPDVMFEYLARRLATIANKAQQHGVSAEDARLVATHFSTLAVYVQDAGIDARVTTALRDLVRAKEHRAVVTLDIDRARMRARLKRYGVDANERWLDAPRPDRQTREQALDDLVRLGLTGMFARIASTFERTAVELDRHVTRTAGIRRIQADDWRTQFCPTLWAEVSYMSALAAASCAANIFVPQIDSSCLLAEMSLMTLLAAYWALCL